MIEYQVTIHIDRPVEQVFEFITNANNLHVWQSNFLEYKEMTEKALQVGSRFIEVRKMGGKPSEIQAEITDFEPNQRFATQTLTEPKATVSYDFKAVKDGTEVGYKFMLQTKGMMRILQPMIVRSIKKETEADFKNLKHILEG